MTAFFASVVILAVMVGAVVLVGKRRPVGKPVTWGEAFVAAVWVFGILLMIYGVVPDRWLRWADGELRWRSDAIGIPTGPIKHFDWWFIKIDKHVLWPKGLTFMGRGRVLISKQVIRDIIASLFYVVFGLGQIWMWFWWQNRGKGKPATPELETSAYGRPLVRGS